MAVDMLADRMNRVASSPTLKVGLEAARLRRTGADVVDFGAGEPDFSTPPSAKAEAKAAIVLLVSYYHHEVI